MRDLKSGAQLASRYTLVGKLGAGGGAETWLASDKLTRASVALKILVDETIPAATLRREWQLSIRLVHAHIARVFEFHDADTDGQQSAFYSMQYIDGPDISVASASMSLTPSTWVGASVVSHPSTVGSMSTNDALVSIVAPRFTCAGVDKINGTCNVALYVRRPCVASPCSPSDSP